MPKTPTAILLGCVKSKVDYPAAAKDLYCSQLWNRRRAYAEASRLPWMILSAEYDLVDPDRRLHPYDLALKDLSAMQRREWGRRVVESLEEQFGALAGARFEVHAGATYRNALFEPLSARGASITVPFDGLRLGDQLKWYTAQVAPLRRRRATQAEIARALRDLDRRSQPIAARDWPGSARDLDQPGLYSWWVDRAGAKDITEGLGARVGAARIYAGQTGATKWPSGAVGTRTLAQRIGGNHLRGSISASTFRLTLAAVLVGPLQLVTPLPGKLDRASEERLSEWMDKHLRVAIHPFPERDALADLEDHVLAALDPPLNIEGMPSTRLRRALAQCRGQLRSLPTNPNVGVTGVRGNARSPSA